MPHWAKEPKDRKKLDKVEYVLGSKVKPPPPTIGDSGIYFDNAAALLSRQYDRDRDRVIHRAITDGVCGVMCWHPEIDKLEELHNLSSAYESFCYFMAGVHPDNISRTNKSQQEAWHLKVDEYSRERGCRAIYSGLNLTRRDVHSFFAQESMLRCLYLHAKVLCLPLVVFLESREADAKPGLQFGPVVNTNLVRLTEVLAEEGWGRGSANEDVPVIIQDALAVCRGDVAIMQSLVDSGYYASISTCDLFSENATAEEQTVIRSCLNVIPHSKLLISSNSPSYTPKNIPDESIKLAKNEPSNFKFILQLVAPYFGLAEHELAVLNLENSKHVYRIDGSLIVPEKCRKHEIESSKMPAGNETDPGATLVNMSIGADTSAETNDLAQCYACLKCATILFSNKHLVYKHSITSAEMPSSVFQAAEFVASASSDSCTAVYYVPSALLGTVNGAYVDTLAVDAKGNISCKSCNTKIGKQFEATGSDNSGLACPCGFVVDCGEGLLRLSSAKVQPHSTAVSRTKAKRDIVEDGDVDVGRAARGKGKDKDVVTISAEADKALAKQQAKMNTTAKKGKSTRKNH